MHTLDDDDESTISALDEARAVLGLAYRSEEMREKIKRLKHSQAIDLPLKSTPGVYRFWDEDDNCLYVGQSTQLHPLLRIVSHRQKPWWDEVVRADFIACSGRTLLDDFERYQILLLQPKYNRAYHPVVCKSWFEEACA